MAKKTFKVYPNPYVYIDHDGYPAGACPCDMPEHVGMTSRRFVGAKLDSEETRLLEKLSKEESRYRDARQQTRFAFDFSEPTTLPVTEYYRDRLNSSELIAADAETHKQTSIVGDFVSPKDALAKAKAAAVKRWAAERGDAEKPEGIDSLDAAIAAIGGTSAPATTKTVKGA
jgi:hypothetical protein